MIDPRLAETLIILIPKIEPPSQMKDLRPISLCNVVFKLIMKVLVHRLRPHLENIVGPLQSSFRPGHGTRDNAIIAQEIIHHMQESKKKTGDLLLKIDLEKAYDCIDWSFLQDMLIDFGFEPLTVNLIMSGVTSNSPSLLWNGEKLQQLTPT